MQSRRPQSHRFVPAWPALVGLAICVCGTSAPAHEGPPFPILMDEPLGSYKVSVWADPDIGEAEFFIVVESPEGGMPQDAPRVSMWFEPVSGRLQRTECPTTRQPLRNRMQFHAEPYFDSRDMWRVGFRLESGVGEAANAAELVREIESTPDGFGAWDIAIYLFPFLLLGGMWVLALLRRRSLRATPEAPKESSSSHPHAELLRRSLEVK